MLAELDSVSLYSRDAVMNVVGAEDVSLPGTEEPGMGRTPEAVVPDEEVSTGGRGYESSSSYVGGV